MFGMFGHVQRQENHEQDYLNCLESLLSKVPDKNAVLSKIKERYPKVYPNIAQSLQFDSLKKEIAHPNDPSKTIAKLSGLSESVFERERNTLYSIARLDDGTWAGCCADYAGSGVIYPHISNENKYTYNRVKNWQDGFSCVSLGKYCAIFGLRGYEVYKRDVLIHSSNLATRRVIFRSHANTSRRVLFYRPLNYIYMINDQDKLYRIDVSNEYKETLVLLNAEEFCFSEDKIYVLCSDGHVRSVSHTQTVDNSDGVLSSAEPIIDAETFYPGSIIKIDQGTLMVTGSNQKSSITDFFLVDAKTLEKKGSFVNWTPVRGVRITPVLWLKKLPRTLLPENFPANIELIIACNSTDIVSLLAVVDGTKIVPINGVEVKDSERSGGINFLEILDNKILICTQSGDLMRVNIEF